MTRSWVAFALCLMAQSIAANAKGFAAQPRNDRVLAGGVTAGPVFIALEQSRLSALVAAYPELRVERHGDAGNARRATCLAVKTPRGRLMLRMSSGELQGNDVIDDVRVSAVNTAQHCPISIRADGVSLDNGIAIGGARSGVTKLLGRPSVALGNAWRFDYETPAFFIDRNACAASGSMTVDFAGDTVIGFSASKDTSC